MTEKVENLLIEFSQILTLPSKVVILFCPPNETILRYIAYFSKNNFSSFFYPQKETFLRTNISIVLRSSVGYWCLK